MARFRNRRDAGRILAHTHDDGLATGASMRAAIPGLPAQHPARIVVAVPPAAPETCEEFNEEVDEVVCATTPGPCLGPGRGYEDFSQSTDEGARLFPEDIRPQLVPGWKNLRKVA